MPWTAPRTTEEKVAELSELRANRPPCAKHHERKVSHQQGGGGHSGKSPMEDVGSESQPEQL